MLSLLGIVLSSVILVNYRCSDLVVVVRTTGPLSSIPYDTWKESTNLIQLIANLLRLVCHIVSVAYYTQDNSFLSFFCTLLLLLYFCCCDDLLMITKRQP